MMSKINKNANKKIAKKTIGKEITKETTFGEAMAISPKAAKILAEEHMFCGCCPMAMMETINQGALAHGVDVTKLLKKLNKK